VASDLSEAPELLAACLSVHNFPFLRWSLISPDLLLLCSQSGTEACHRRDSHRHLTGLYASAEDKHSCFCQDLFSSSAAGQNNPDTGTATTRCESKGRTQAVCERPRRPCPHESHYRDPLLRPEPPRILRHKQSRRACPTTKGGSSGVASLCELLLIA